jgi:beta-lactamase class A
MGRRDYLGVAAALLIGAVCGAAGLNWYHNRSCGDYKYINADFRCGKKQAISKAAYIVLENDLRRFIDARVAARDASKISVYFRDLRLGPTFGLHETEEFAPASLLKLPLVLTYFALDEAAPGLLQMPLTYSSDLVREKDALLRQKAAAKSDLRDGGTYPIEELLRSTLEYSDNVAYLLLIDYLSNSVPEGTRNVLRTFQELGVVDPRDITEEVASVRGYASLLRILYNASYLSVEASEKVLSWLVLASFDKGLVAGLPEGTPLANKFGERDLPDGTQQVHDCGIIYYPDNPYLLCVMTKGWDWEKLTQIIVEISRMVYSEVNSRRGK